MNTRKITFILIAAFALLVIAGTKVSQLTRTRALQETSRFLVSTQDVTTGRWSSRYITAPDLATNLGPWITNISSGSGSLASYVLTNNDTKAVQLAGSLLVSGRQTNNEAVRLNDDITQTAGLNADFAFLSANTLDVNGTNITAVIHALGTNITYTSNDLYNAIVAAGISAPTATNIARYFATNSALITSNQLELVKAPKTNATLYGNVTIDGATASEIAAFNASKQLVPVAGISATEAGYLDGVTDNIQDQINETPNAVSPQGFRLSNRLLERIADWRHAGLEFYDSFEREGLTNYPGTSDSGHVWGHAPIGTTTNLVWIGGGRFRHATNGPTGPHYWGVTRTNLSVNWGWFGGTVMYEGLGNNGWEDTATIILCRSLDFNTSQPYLHFRVLRTGLQVQLSQTNNLINETYPIPLTNNVLYTFNAYVHSNRLIAQVGNNRYEVTHDSLAQESITNATVLIFEHNRRTTNITSGYYASYGDAWAGPLPFHMHRYMTDGIYRGSNGVINSITFADGTTQTTAGGSGGSGTNNPVLLTTAPTISLIADQTAAVQFSTNQSFAFTVTGNSNQSSAIVLQLQNTSTNTIYASNSFGLYALRDGSNVTAFAIPPSSILQLNASLDRSNRWVAVQSTKDYALLFGANITPTTNHTDGTISIAASGGSATVAFNVTNITVSATNEIVIDLAAFDLAKVSLLTNLNRITFSNPPTMGKRGQVYFQQDTNGTRTIANWNVAGGRLQMPTNATTTLTTNANAVDVLEAMPGFHNTNLFAWWPQDFHPRIGITNSLDDGIIDCSAAGQSFLTIQGVTASAQDYYASAFASDGQDICKVELNLAVNASETASFFVELRSAAATNSPSQTVLATSDTKTPVQIGTTTNYVTFSFPSTVSTASGSTNWWVVRKTAASPYGLNFGRASGSVNLMKSSPDGIAWTDVTTTRQGNYRTLKP